MYLNLYHFKTINGLSWGANDYDLFSLIENECNTRESACVLMSYEYLNSSLIFSLPILQNLFILTYNL